MKKKRIQNRNTPQKGQLTETQKKFIREFARETAIAATEIWRGMVQAPFDGAATVAPISLEPLQRDSRGRFVRRQAE